MTAIVLSPSPSASMNFGDVSAVTATANDSSGNAVANAKINWTSSNISLLTVSATGGKCGDSLDSTNRTCLCAGKWDANIIVCDSTSLSTSGTATLTATVGNVSSSITVFVHPRVARVVVSAPPASGGCTSVGGTIQASAQAFDANNNPVAVGPDQSAFLWGTSDNGVVTVANGLLTATSPGLATISATASGVTSIPVGFNTCAVKSISAHLSGVPDTTFTGATAASQILVADVVDTKGTTITMPSGRLLWSSSDIGIAAVDQVGTLSTKNPGSAAIIVTCRPTACNNGYGTVINSNPVIANVTGTTSPTLIVASTTSTSLFPIDSTGTVGTAITLPANPNSIVYANTALGAYIGTDTGGLLAYDATANTVGSVANVNGLVLGVSDDGSLVVVFDNTSNTVNIVNNGAAGASLVDQYIVAGIPPSCRTTSQCPKASFTPDSKSVFVVGGSQLYVSTVGGTLRKLPLAQTANDVAVTNQGSFAFVANGNPTIDTFATCNLSQLNSNTVNVSGAIQRMISSTNGAKIYAVIPPSLTTMTLASNFAGCPPPLSTTLASVDLGQGTFTTRDIIAATPDNFVVMLTSGTQVVIYDVANNAGSAVALSGGANVLTGGVTADGTFAFVGGSDNKVHKIDLVNKTDASQITVTITPELVAVRPQ